MPKTTMREASPDEIQELMDKHAKRVPAAADNPEKPAAAEKETISPVQLSPEQQRMLADRLTAPCPHCSKSPMEPAVQPTEDDRKEWFRALLGDRPFKRTYSLALDGEGSEFKAVFTSLEPEQNERYQTINDMIFSINKTKPPENPMAMKARSNALVLFQSLIRCESIGRHRFGPSLLDKVEVDSSEFDLLAFVREHTAKVNEVQLAMMIRMHNQFNSLYLSLLQDSVDGNFTTSAGHA